MWSCYLCLATVKGLNQPSSANYSQSFHRGCAPGSRHRGCGFVKLYLHAFHDLGNSEINATKLWHIGNNSDMLFYPCKGLLLLTIDCIIANIFHFYIFLKH